MFLLKRMKTNQKSFIFLNKHMWSLKVTHVFISKFHYIS